MQRFSIAFCYRFKHGAEVQLCAFDMLKATRRTIRKHSALGVSDHQTHPARRPRTNVSRSLGAASVTPARGNIGWSGNLTKFAGRYPHPVWSRMARVRNWRQPAPHCDLELRNSQCSVLRSTSGFCRPQCFSTRSCRRRSRPPQSSFRSPQLPSASDASARSSGQGGATDEAISLKQNDAVRRRSPALDSCVERCPPYCSGSFRMRSRCRMCSTWVAWKLPMGDGRYDSAGRAPSVTSTISGGTPRRKGMMLQPRPPETITSQLNLA
jgi:hypothetical protein